MGHRILLAYDGTEQADRAARWVAETFPDDDVTILTILDPMEGFLDTFGYGSHQHERWRDDAEDAAEELLAAAEAIVGEATVETIVRSGAIPRTIVSVAEELEIDHIVLGSHGRTGVSRVLLGSVAETVMRRAPTTVSIVR